MMNTETLCTYATVSTIDKSEAHQLNMKILQGAILQEHQKIGGKKNKIKIMIKTSPLYNNNTIESVCCSIVCTE